jgi:hypothetical protein
MELARCDGSQILPRKLHEKDFLPAEEVPWLL